MVEAATEATDALQNADEAMDAAPHVDRSPVPGKQQQQQPPAETPEVGHAETATLANAEADPSVFAIACDRQGQRQHLKNNSFRILTQQLHEKKLTRKMQLPSLMLVPRTIIQTPQQSHAASMSNAPAQAPQSKSPTAKTSKPPSEL